MGKISHYNILLVEDEVMLLQSLANRINSLNAGFKVTSQAANGEEVLQHLKNENIHLVMTDIRMPVMDGLKLVKKIHEQYPNILTMILSSYADFEYAREALKQGVFEYLLKPVPTEDLENALGHARLQLHKSFELEEFPGFSGKAVEDIVEYVALYMREHYMDDIDISSFCSELGFTSAYLTKLFNKYRGETPLKYLTDTRIHEAKRLLSNTTLPIREVGERVGYPDQFHFSKTFRKLTGMNPSAYRKQMEAPHKD